jgi:hypothetical protein
VGEAKLTSSLWSRKLERVHLISLLGVELFEERPALRRPSEWHESPVAKFKFTYVLVSNAWQSAMFAELVVVDGINAHAAQPRAGRADAATA